VIHGKGFNEEERLAYVPDIYKNIFDAMELLTQKMKRSLLFESLRVNRGSFLIPTQLAVINLLTR
jgi:hypothetical protein